MSAIQILIAVILIVNLIVLCIVLIKISNKKDISADLERLERGQKQDAGQLRQEVVNSLLGFNESIQKAVDAQLEKVRSTVDEKLQKTSPQTPRVLTFVKTRFKSPTPITRLCISPNP